MPLDMVSRRSVAPTPSPSSSPGAPPRRSCRESARSSTAMPAASALTPSIRSTRSPGRRCASGGPPRRHPPGRGRQAPSSSRSTVRTKRSRSWSAAVIPSFDGAIALRAMFSCRTLTVGLQVAQAALLDVLLDEGTHPVRADASGPSPPHPPGAAACRRDVRI